MKIKGSHKSPSAVRRRFSINYRSLDFFWKKTLRSTEISGYKALNFYIFVIFRVLSHLKSQYESDIKFFYKLNTIFAPFTILLTTSSIILTARRVYVYMYVLIVVAKLLAPIEIPKFDSTFSGNSPQMQF